MAYNESLAQRLKALIETDRKLQEKKMFGGIAFLLNGNMCCGVHGDEVILRVDPEKYEMLLSRPNVREFDMTGRPIKGWLMLERAGWSKSKALGFWIEEAVGYAAGLKRKKRSPKRRVRRPL
jgi:TfoX/Sxy family transcriptional regulator of competence genes